MTLTRARARPLSLSSSSRALSPAQALRDGAGRVVHSLYELKEALALATIAVLFYASSAVLLFHTSATIDAHVYPTYEHAFMSSVYLLLGNVRAPASPRRRALSTARSRAGR